MPISSPVIPIKLSSTRSHRGAASERPTDDTDQVPANPAINDGELSDATASGLRCDHPGCRAKVTRPGDIKDHKLSKHGIEDPTKLTHLQALRRIDLAIIHKKIWDAAARLNSFKNRIAAAERALKRQDPGYRSVHGLDVEGLWLEDVAPEDTEEGKARVKALKSNRPSKHVKPVSEYCAEVLRDLRMEAADQGKLQNGMFGGYEQIADQLEDLVVGDDDDTMGDAE